jgi:hypothetical protein
LPERIPCLTTARHLAETWISAGFNVSLIHRILDDETGSTAKREIMFQLGHFQFATELAYSRLRHQATKESASGNAPSFAPLFTCSADAHMLLVSASGYWRALKELLRLMPFPHLMMLIDEVEHVMKTTVMARNHVEHITERLVNGRRRRTDTPEISTKAFQQAIARIEFPSIIFADEAFDLALISGTILSIGSRIAPALETTFQTGIDRYVDTILPIGSEGDS